MVINNGQNVTGAQWRWSNNEPDGEYRYESDKDGDQPQGGSATLRREAKMI